MELTLDRVYQAAHVLKPVINRTDLVHATRIEADCDLYLKTENLQNTGSFKIRGAYFKISTLSEEDKKKGVVACSAGNHAQGVALAATKAGTKSTIFLPAIAPISKVEATRNYGAEVRMIDGVYDDAYNAAVEYQKESGAVFIHPFHGGARHYRNGNHGTAGGRGCGSGSGRWRRTDFRRFLCGKEIKPEV